MKCLILGGTGFIGRHLTRKLLKFDAEVTVFSSGKIKETDAELCNRVKYINGDFSDISSCLSFELQKADYVFHLISTTNPTNLDSLKDLTENIIPTIQLFDCLRDSDNLKKIIFISSGGTVYGIPNSIPIGEYHLLAPISSYGVQKATIEHYLSYYGHHYGLPHLTIRLSNPYGVGQNPHSNQGVIANFLAKALKNEKIEIWGDGTVIRDFIYISDVIDGIAKCMTYTGNKVVFNLGSGVGYSILDILNVIEDKVSHSLNIEFKPSRRQDVPVNILNIALAKAELKWTPKISVEDGINMMIPFLEKFITSYKSEYSHIDNVCIFSDEYIIMRLTVFAAYDKNGLIHDYVCTYIKYLREVSDRIVFVSDNTYHNLDKIKSLVDATICNFHGEYDFGSYKRGFHLAQKKGWLDNCDEVIFCNDSCFCIGSFSNILEEMESQKCDFWGMTGSFQVAKHLQSYFLVLKRGVFNHACFRKYIDSIERKNSFWDVVTSYEVPLLGILEKEGFQGKAFSFAIANENPTQYPLKLIKKGVPLVKIKVFSIRSFSKENLCMLFFNIRKNNNAASREIINYFGIKKFLIHLIPTFARDRRINSKGKLRIKFFRIPLPTILFKNKLSHVVYVY